MNRDQIRGTIAAVASVSIFSFGLSLTLPLLAILLEEMGASGFQIGLNGAAAAMAMLLGGFILPAVLRRTGLQWLLVLSILLMAGVLLLFLAVPDVWVWMAFRLVLGFTGVSIFFCSEIWIISSAPERRRGLMIGVYVLFLSFGFFLGPALLTVIGHQGWTPFILGSAISLLAIPPVLWAWRSAPDLSEHTETGGGEGAIRDVLGFFRSDPALLWAIALFGCIEFGAMGLIPVWSLRVGIDQQGALVLVALLAAGNVVMQLPMGWIGDQFDRRKLLTICAAICVGAASLIPSISRTEWPLWITMAFWGGIVVGLYTFSLNELGARYSGAAFARANGAFMTAYGLGALVSPPLLGMAMDTFPPHGLFGVMALAAGGYLLLLLLRRGRTA